MPHPTKTWMKVSLRPSLLSPRCASLTWNLEMSSILGWKIFHPPKAHIQSTCGSSKGSRHVIRTYGGFLKWWFPTTMGFPTKNDQHLECEMGVPPFKETPIFQNTICTFAPKSFFASQQNQLDGIKKVKFVTKKCSTRLYQENNSIPTCLVFEFEAESN